MNAPPVDYMLSMIERLGMRDLPKKPPNFDWRRTRRRTYGVYMPGTRYVFVSGFVQRTRGLKLPVKSRRPRVGMNSDCFAYDIRRVRRAIRNV